MSTESFKCRKAWILQEQIGKGRPGNQRKEATEAKTALGIREESTEAKAGPGIRERADRKKESGAGRRRRFLKKRK